MKIGDTYREKGSTWIWARCPECLEERGVRKKGPSPHRLCKACHYKLWHGIWINKGE